MFHTLIMNELIPTLITIAIVMGADPHGLHVSGAGRAKVSAWMQDRIGPNRVGPYGLIQPVADAHQDSAQRRRHPFARG